jgi:excisionase family DNA binding protein
MQIISNDLPALADDLLEGAAAAANYIGLTRRKVYRMTEKGDLPAIRKGNRIFYRKSDLQRAFQAA